MFRHTKLTKANIGDNYGTLAETLSKTASNKKQNPQLEVQQAAATTQFSHIGRFQKAVVQRYVSFPMRMNLTRALLERASDGKIRIPRY